MFYNDPILMKKLHFLLFICFISSEIRSQLISGPMLGPVELRTASIWCESKPGSILKLEYWPEDALEQKRSLSPESFVRFKHQIDKFSLIELQPGTNYRYQLIVNNKTRPANASGRFKTQILWNYRFPAPDFSFLAGSCAYTNETVYDRPGKPYGGDSSIFNQMAKEDAAFMLWLGDNWYYREVDYGSNWGLWYRASRDRSRPALQPFLKKMAHYAIWDDHDYGLNNDNQSFIYKEETRMVFDQYWCNPQVANQGGIYTRFSYNDVDFFLMDDRSYRTSDYMKDSINGQPNPNKQMWGKEQLNWLKNQLLTSRAPFKIIANGTPILNQYNNYDCMVHFVLEQQELLQFIEDEQINGVIFITGDRHHSEISRKKLKNGYYLYDIVNSSLTAGLHILSEREINNPDLLADKTVNQNNYTRFLINGKPKERTLKLEFKDLNGNVLKDWLVNENELKFITESK